LTHLYLYCLVFCFFFYSYLTPLDLHTFPTRRSSDLRLSRNLFLYSPKTGNLLRVSFFHLIPGAMKLTLPPSPTFWHAASDLAPIAIWNRPTPCCWERLPSRKSMCASSPPTFYPIKSLWAPSPRPPAGEYKSIL